MADKQQDPRTDAERRPTSTSPLEGKTHEATKPPGQGPLDREAERKSREGLELAGGGH